MLLVLLLQAAMPQATRQVDPPALRAWGSFSRSPALARRREQVDIATDGADARSNLFHYQLRLTTTGAGEPDTLWASSRTCPAIRPLIGSMRELQLPRPMPPGFDDEAGVILMDGIGYEISVPAIDRFNAGRIVWRSNMGTPLAAWVERSFAALEACWSPEERRVWRDGEP